ncbi:hypothetical protein [Nocardia pseudobrasiliensis]|uniref:Transmembrane protein n=1 Tax=Nocardia pseudobrasiliensis TaxID=45979 RepID=A0A370IAD7_9NOCA|nr:hypothetical protein [Nocardia pseudobrasiliensis]RDI67699.1 hypothetical protein DFR76_10296 [Nocardia pseudobrasiliensis]
MHTFTAIVKSLGEVVAIAVVLGAGLPIVFGLGIRFWSMETVGPDGAVARRNPVAQAVAYICFAVVIVAVVAGILYIAKDFISHTFDVQLFGAKPPKK